MDRSLFVLLLITAVVGGSFSSDNANKINEIVEDGARHSKSDDLLWNVLADCVAGEVKSVSTCFKMKVLKHFDYDVGRIAGSRSLSDKKYVEKIDRLVVKQFQKYLNTHAFQITLPEFLFQNATLVFDPKKGLLDFDVKFPQPPENEDRSMSAARDMMQQKALLPLLLMLKMKLKMITPIMLTLVSVKATKALLMSKLALLLVSVFMFSQVVKKLGMHLPMLHPPPMEMLPMSMTTPPTYGPPPSQAAYGAPSPSSSSYGVPSQSASYSEPNPWEPSSSSSSNSYSKIWDPQQIAYNAYYKPGGSSSSLISSSTSSS